MTYAGIPHNRKPPKRNEKLNAKKDFKMKFKQKQKLYDAITYQHFKQATNNHWSQCFFTLTLSSPQPSSKSTEQIGRFMDKLRKHCKRIQVAAEIDQDFFSYVWVREQTKKKVDHFHCVCVLPCFPIPKRERKHPLAKYSIPFFFTGETESKYATLNKMWCDCRGQYSTNAVRISRDKHGNLAFMINDLKAATRYVTKYISKSEENTNTRTHAISNNLVKWTQPLPLDDFYGLVMSPYYSQGVWSKEEKKEIPYIEKDFCSIGKLYPQKAFDVYNEVLQIQIDRKIEHWRQLCHATRIKALNKRLAKQMHISM